MTGSEAIAGKDQEETKAAVSFMILTKSTIHHRILGPAKITDSMEYQALGHMINMARYAISARSLPRAEGTTSLHL